LLDGVIASRAAARFGDDTRTERVWAMMVSGNY
jgi:hypothetical protein